MTILFDLTSLFHNYSGVERYAEKIASGCISMDKKHNYILLFKNEIASSFESFRGYNNVRMIVLNGKNKLVFNQLILPFALYTIKADAYVFLAFPEPWLFFNKNIYTAIHDMAPWDCGGYMPLASRLYYRLSHLHTFVFSKKVLTISKYSGRRIRAYAKAAGKKYYISIKHKLRLVYCGVDKNFDNNISEVQVEEVKAKYGLPDKYILSLATLEPRKNMKLLIEAYAKLDSKDKLGLVLAGRAGWKLKEAIGDTDSLEDIVFTGFVPDEDLPALYSGCQLFVFPSNYEGFGMPPLEALNCGKKVLVSDIEVHKEILGQGAIYFRHNDVDDLRKQLEDWTLGNIEDNTKENTEAVCNQYTWDKAARRLLKLLE